MRQHSILSTNQRASLTFEITNWNVDITGTQTSVQYCGKMSFDTSSCSQKHQTVCGLCCLLCLTDKTQAWWLDCTPQGDMVVKSNTHTSLQTKTQVCWRCNVSLKIASYFKSHFIGVKFPEQVHQQFISNNWLFCWNSTGAQADFWWGKTVTCWLRGWNVAEEKLSLMQHPLNLKLSGPISKNVARIQRYLQNHRGQHITSGAPCSCHCGLCIKLFEACVMSFICSYSNWLQASWLLS